MVVTAPERSAVVSRGSLAGTGPARKSLGRGYAGSSRAPVSMSARARLSGLPLARRGKSASSKTRTLLGTLNAESS